MEGDILVRCVWMGMRLVDAYGVYESVLGVLCVVSTIVLVCMYIDSVVDSVGRYASLFYVLDRIPYVSGYIRKRFEYGKRLFKEGIPKSSGKVTKTIPKEGMKIGVLVKRLEELDEQEAAIRRSGKNSGSVFPTEEELLSLNQEAYRLFSSTDISMPHVYKYSKQLENEVVHMMIDLFRGNSDCCGMTTSGGSESLELAMLAHKLYYRDKKGIKRPEVIVSETVHAAVYKAGEFFDIKLVVVPVKKNFEADTEGMMRAITPNTILIISSCPNFPIGNCDPLQPFADIAKTRDFGIHLDCCMGGFFLPYAKKHGVDLPEKNYNFTVKGVTSISTDPHKYGLSGKGSGVLLFGNHDIQKSLYHCKVDGPSSLFASGRVSESRTAGPIAACWATLMYMGDEGYSKQAKRIFEETREMSEKLKMIEGIDVIGNPVVG